MQLTMKSKVILFNVLLFCSKIVDSVPHSEDHVRQRVNPPSNWQVNQNAPNAQYLHTDFTQTRNVNIQPENTQDYYPNQGRRHNYDSNVYYRSPASSPSAEDLLVSYDSPADGSRLDSYPPRVEPYPSRTSQVGFENQNQYRNQNWRPQNQYTKPAPSAVLIPDDERPLVTTVQEPYRSPVLYLQPKYVPSTNRRFYHPGRSYLTREQVQYPLTDNRKYVANSAPRFESSGSVPYENYGEDQVAASEIKTRPTVGRRYTHIIAPQSGITYNEAPAVIAPDTLTDQSENIEFAENYRSRPVLSNSAPITNQDVRSPLISEPDNNSENYGEDQVAASEINTRPTGGRRYTHSIAPQSSITYNEAPAVIAPDTLTDQSENIEFAENYRSRPVLSNSAPITNQDVRSPLISEPDNNSENYGEDQVAASEIKTRPTVGRRYTHIIAPQSGITYNEAPAVIAPDTLTDQSENIEFTENYRSRPVLSNYVPITNQDVRSPLISEPDNNSENYGEDQVAASEIKTRPTGGRRYTHSIAPQSGIIYNEAPAVIAPDTLTDQSENIEFAENYRSRPVLSNYAPITNQDVRSPLISEPDNNSDTSNLAHINTEKEAPVIIGKILSEKPLARRYAHNYRSDSGWSNIVDDDSVNGAPVVNEPVEVKSGKYEANYGPREPVPISTNSEAPSAPSDTVLVNSGSNKREETHQAPNSPTPTNTNPKQNVYSTISSEGITEYNLSSFVSKPEIQDILAKTNKRYVVVHSNGTVEFLDTIDLGSPQNSKLRLVHHKRKNIDGSDSDEVLTQQSPENLPINIAKTPFSVDEYPLPTNNQPADDKKPTRLNVEAKPADQYDSNKSSPLKYLPANHSNLKPSPQQEKQPADNNNSKLLTSSSTSNKDQSTQNGNLKPLPKDVNQLRNDDDSKTLIPPVNHSAADGNSKPLPQDGNKPAEQKNQSVDDDNLKPLPSKEDQPANDDNSKLDQTKDENNFTPLFPNTRQPAHIKKPKSHDDKPFHYYRRHPAHYHKSKHSHINQPADNNNSNPSTPGESQLASDSNLWPSNEDQSGGETDSASLLPYKKHPVHRYKPKSRYSHYQAADDNPSATPKLLTYPENQPGGDKNSNPSSRNENAPENNDNSKPLPSSEHQSGDETGSISLTSHKTHQSHHYKPKSRYSPDQPADDKKPTPLNVEAKPADQYDSNKSSPLNDLPANHSNLKPSPQQDKQPADNNNSKLLPSSSTSNKDQSTQNGNLKPLPQDVNQLRNDDDSKTLIPPVNHSAADGNSKPLPQDGNKPAEQQNQSADDDNLKPLTSKEDQPANDDNSKLDQTKDENNYNPLFPNTRQPAHIKKPKSHDDKPFHYYRRHPAHYHKSKHSHINQPADNNNSNPSTPGESQPASDSNLWPSNEDQSGGETDSASLLPYKNHPVHRYKPKSRYSHYQAADDNPSATPKLLTYPENQPGGDKNSNPSSRNEDAPENNDNSKPLPSNEHQSGDETGSISLTSHKKHQSHHYKPKSKYSHDQPADDNNSTPSSTPLLNYPENQPGDDDNSYPSSPSEDQTGDDNDSEPLPANGTQPANNTKSKPIHGVQQGNDNNPTSPDENQPEEDKKSKPLRPNENQPTDDLKAKPTSADAGKNDEQSNSTTVSPTEPNYTTSSKPEVIKTHKRKHIHGTSNTNSPVVSTTPCPDDTSVNQIITLSPIEQTTDNVSDVPPVATTTTTTTRPVKTPGKSDNDANNKQDDGQDGITKTSSTTRVSPSTSTSPTGNISDDKTKGPKENENTQTTNSDDDNSYPSSPSEDQTGDDNDSEPLPANGTQPANNTKSEPIHGAQPGNDNNPTSPDENQPEEDKKSKPLRPNENQPTDDLKAKPTSADAGKNDEQSNSTTVSPTEPNYTTSSKPEVIKTHKRKHIQGTSNTNSPVVSTTPCPDDTSENQIITLSPIEQTTDNVSDVPPVVTTTTTATRPVKTPGKSDNDANNKQDDGQDGITKTSSTTRVSPSTSTSPTGNISDDKTKGPKENENTQTTNSDDDNSYPSSPSEDQTGDDNDSEPLPANGTQPANNTKSKPIHGAQPGNDNNPTSPDENQPEEDKKSKLLRPNENQPTDDLKAKPTSADAGKNDDQSNSTTVSPTEPNYTTSSKPEVIKTHKRKHIQGTSNTNSPFVSTTPCPDDTSENQIITLSPIEQTTDNVSDVPPVVTTTTTATRPVKTPGKSDNDANNKQDDGQDGITKTSSTTRVSPSTSTSPTGNISDDKTKGPKENENTQTTNSDDDNSYPSSPSEDQTGDDNDSEPLPANGTQPANNTKSKPIHGAQPGNDNNPTSPDENQPEEDKKSKLLRPNENQPTDDLKAKPTSADAGKNDDQSNSTTVSPTEPNYTTSSKPEVIKTHKRKHIHGTSNTNSPVVSTTPCPDDTSEYQIITLSPIEQTTDNVSDVPPVVTTTTTITRPVKTPGKSDNDANNKQDDGHDGITKISSTTRVSPSTSTSPTGNISDDKTKGPNENENTQTKDKTDVDQEKDTQTAVHNSSELFDTNTDVPAESDDYSSVTASPSVQYDVDTGDASDDNSSELEQSETDVTITVSSSTANDSEDEIITINVEVSDSTDDADSSSSDKNLVVSMDTNDGSDDDSKTPKPEDCKKDHNSNDKGKNVEIDMSNLKGKPTMWIRTTNQDFVDKLTAKNDTEYDLIYFFHIENQPAIEREKTTTIYCNGTVVTEIIEITYANKDDLTPTIVKTTQIMDREDYRAHKV